MRFEKVVFVLTLVMLVPCDGFKDTFCIIKEFWWMQYARSPEPTDRIPEMQSLAPSCEVDVGTCQTGTCSTNTRRHKRCPDDGYICPETENRTANCGASGVIAYDYVLRCVCCKANSVIGIVKDSATDEPLGNMIIYVDGNLAGFSGTDGNFEVKRPADVLSFVIRAIDENGDYFEAVKVIGVPVGFQDSIYVELFMIKKAEPFEIDSTAEIVLSLSDNPQDPLAGNSFIEIRPDSFESPFGVAYNGMVKTRITFIGPDSLNERTTQGEFVTTDGQRLVTDGIVIFSFSTASDERLQLSRPVLFQSNTGMKFWKLETTVGRWAPVEIVPESRKRQSIPADWVNIETETWYNIDIIFTFPPCFFKIRVFTEGNEEATPQDLVSYTPKLKAETSTGLGFIVTFESTKEPSTKCYEARCPENSDLNYDGLISVSMSSVEIVNGNLVLTDTSLTPRPLAGYTIGILAPLEEVNYEDVTNAVNVTFISDDVGPFYPTLDICVNSNADQPAFHFILP
ncbi:cartilage intermediate layer protein 2-like [Ruditapes philippinarum]|uniref:cartilage intermediate layer protein 2-like n=1 Tax=Ruditapes philippinarum TaxID=129788 RepID=UPI00295BB2E6|nr:cartilage intermediate layer protein 2-like [Ruditapes philippinarum]